MLVTHEDEGLCAVTHDCLHRHDETRMGVAGGVNLQEGTDVAVKPVIVRPRQYRKRAEIPRRDGNLRDRGSGRDGSLLDWRLFYGVDA